jgi:hypothetical protein
MNDEQVEFAEKVIEEATSKVSQEEFDEERKRRSAGDPWCREIN